MSAFALLAGMLIGIGVGFRAGRDSMKPPKALPDEGERVYCNRYF